MRAYIRIMRDKYDGISSPFIASDERRPDRRVPSTMTTTTTIEIRRQTLIQRGINGERKTCVFL